MGRFLKRWIPVLLSVILMLLCSCDASAQISEADSAVITQLGETLVEDLNTVILKNRRTPRELAALGYVVYSDEEMLGSDPLAKFYMESGEGIDTDLTIVFSNQSFVVARIVFRGEKGYYLRYEYNKSKPRDRTVSGKRIDDVSLKYYEAPPKWEMTLSLAKKEVAGFILKNPLD